MSGYSTLAFTKEGMYIFDPITLKSGRASKMPTEAKHIVLF